MTSIFANLEKAPQIEVFALSEAFKNDEAKVKVNLTVGAYRDENGQPWVLPVVKKAENIIHSNDSLNKEYLPITGLPEFCLNSIKVLLGENNPLISSKKADGVQTLGGTGGLYLALNFLKTIMKYENVLISKPTWPNHRGISTSLGMTIFDYRYWNNNTKCIDFENLLKDVEAAPNKSVIILHACAHNPTGMDFSKEQWKLIADLMKQKEIFPLLDIAYQGFGSGDLETDAWSTHYLIERGFELLVTQSFSKNFGLYNERVGNVAIITHDAGATQLVKDQMKILIRKCWSNPPDHGARIVSTVLSDESLKAEWKENIRTMAYRVKNMRQQLFEKLTELATPGTWNHVVEQIGMFSYTGLTKEQAEKCKTKYHIYLLSDGRINMCGLNPSNVDYVARAFDDVIRN